MIKLNAILKISCAVSVLLLMIVPSSVSAYTQHAGTQLGNVVPMGHEWITRLAAIELLGGDMVLGDDPGDPRKTWKEGVGKAKNLNLEGAMREVKRIKAEVDLEDTYASTYKPVWDAIVGERWVDIGGSNFASSKYVHDIDCLDLVAQEPAEVQYDHFMRRYNDVGGQGGLDAAISSKERFIQYFVAAAVASPGPMEVWDGGGYSTLVTVDRNYFLFGRALHLFEDSFSSDHTVRSDVDNYEKIRQVKSYLCASGSEQHSHKTLPTYKDGDVIWNSASTIDGRWATYKPSNMKAVALVATEATKDVWAAFIRTMAVVDGDTRKNVAEAEAKAVAQHWLSVNSEQETRDWYAVKSHRLPGYVVSTNNAEDGGDGRSQTACMEEDWHAESQNKKVEEFREGQRECLYNMHPSWGSENEIDHALHLAYNWEWRDNTRFIKPPGDWVINNPFYVAIKLVNRYNQNAMLSDGSDWIKVDGNPEARSGLQFTVPLDSIAAPPAEGISFKVTGRSGYFLNRADGVSRQVGLYQTDRVGKFTFEPLGNGYYNIKNIADNEYMFMESDRIPYVNSYGKRGNSNAQWRIVGVTDPYLYSGSYEVGQGQFAIQRGSDGLLVSARFPPQGVQFNSADLERQKDGTYLIKFADGYVRTSKKGHLLASVKKKTDASKFYLDKLEEGSYLIRGEDGLYWRAEITSKTLPIRQDAETSCPIDTCNPVISEQSDRAAAQPPNCEQNQQKQCSLATPITFARRW